MLERMIRCQARIQLTFVFIAYFGLKSTWFKRRTGMAHQPEVLVGEAAPMSSWVTELLYRLLQWPGLEVRDKTEWPTELTFDVVQKIIENRIKVQQRLYGASSNLPVYVETIDHELKDPHQLRVVMVQSLLPQKSDFVSAGTKLDSPDFRPRHRNHVARLARLVFDKLAAVEEALSPRTSKPQPMADLIVFPELAVHPHDIVILKRLADKSRAMIFTGLVFRQQGGSLVNTSLWLIPFRNGQGRQWITRLQGKWHMTADEVKAGIQPWRPFQLVVELKDTLEGRDTDFG